MHGSMSIAQAFAEQIPKSLDVHSTNEWAVTEARELVLRGVSSSEAFDSVVDVLNLTATQDDSYVFEP